MPCLKAKLLDSRGIDYQVKLSFVFIRWNKWVFKLRLKIPGIGENRSS